MGIRILGMDDTMGMVGVAPAIIVVIGDTVGLSRDIVVTVLVRPLGRSMP